MPLISPKILLVDDSPDNLLVLTALFRDAFPSGTIRAVRSGQKALDHLRKEPCHLVLADLHMPGMSGIELCEAIRQDETLDAVQSMLISAHAQAPTVRARGLEAGALDFISRPIDNHELVARVRNALRMKASLSALQSTIDDLGTEVGTQSLRRARAEQQYRSLFHGIGDAVLTCYPDADGKMGPVRSANQEAVRLLEFPEDELTELRLTDLLQDAEQVAEVADCSWIIRDGSRLYEVRLRTASGKTVLAEVHERVVAMSSATAIVSVLRDVSGRYELQRDARTFRRIADTSNNGMVVTEWDGTIRYVNEAFARLQGKVPFVLRGECLDTLTDAAGRPLFKELMSSLRKDRRLSPFQLRYKRPERAIPLLVQGSVLESVRGAPEALVLTFVDLQDLEQATQRLQDSEQRYQALFNEMLSGVAVHEMIWDGETPIDYRFLVVNDAFERLTGLSRDEVIGKTVKEVLPEIEPYWVERYAEVVRTGQSVTFTAASRELGRVYQVSAFPTAPSQFAASFEDVTERHRAHQQRERLLELEKLLAEISRDFAACPASALREGFEEAFGRLAGFLDCQRLFLLETTFQGDQFSITAEWYQEGLQRVPSPFRVIAAEDFPWVSDHVQAAGATQIQSLDDLPPSARQERRFLQSLGIQCGFLIPLLKEDGPMHGLVAIGWAKPRSAFLADERMAAISISQFLRRGIERADQTRKQEQLQHRLEHLERLKAVGTLAAGVAHEVNNPINIVLNYVSLLREDLSSDAMAIEGLAAIEDSAQRVAEIVRNLLAFSRQGDNDPLVPLDPLQPVEDARSLLNRLLLREGIELTIEVLGDIPKVLASRSELQQVFINLITNARDALNESGTRDGAGAWVKVTLARDHLQEQHVAIRFANNGPTIPVERRRRVFEPFYTTKERTRGTGLGLSLSHGIIERHQGELVVEDDGKALAFVVRLPTADAPAPETE